MTKSMISNECTLSMVAADTGYLRYPRKRFFASLFLKKAAGQVSLEFLILLAVLLSVLGLMIPVFQVVYERSIFALDVVFAQRFCDSFQQKASELALFGSNARFVVRASPLENWALSVEGNELWLEVETDSGLSKEFLRDLPLSAESFSDSVSGSALFELSLSGGVLIVDRKAD